MAEGNGRVPGVEARAGKFPGPSLIPALTRSSASTAGCRARRSSTLSRDMRRPLYEIEGLVSFYPHFRTAAARSGSRSPSAATSRAGSRARAPSVPEGASRCTRCRASGAATGRRSRSSTSAIPTADRGDRPAAERPVPDAGGALRRRTASFTGDPVPVLDDSGIAAWAARASRPARSGRWSAARTPEPKYVICNADEAEPGHVQGPPDPRRAAASGDRGHAHRDARDRRAAGLGVHPPRVRAGGAGAARGARARARRPGVLDGRRRSTSSPRPAATSSARRPR